MEYTLKVEGRETTVLLVALRHQGERLAQCASDTLDLARGAKDRGEVESASSLAYIAQSFLDDSKLALSMHARLLEPEEEIWTDPGCHICGGPSH